MVKSAVIEKAIDPIARFLNGETSAPPIDELEKRLAEARALSETRRSTYSAAVLQAQSGSPDAIKALTESRRALAESELAEREAALALDEAIALSQRREREAAETEFDRRAKIATDNAKKRAKHAENIGRYIDAMATEFKAIIESTRTLNTASPVPLAVHPWGDVTLPGPGSLWAAVELAMHGAGIGKLPEGIDRSKCPRFADRVAEANGLVEKIIAEGREKHVARMLRSRKLPS